MEKWEYNRDGIIVYCYLKKQLDKLNDDLKEEETKLEVLEYDETGVKAVRFDKEPSQTHNKELQDQMRLDMIEKIEEQRKNVDRLKSIIQYQIILINSYEKEYIEKLPSSLKYQATRYFGGYPHKMTLNQLARKFHYSDASSLLKHMKRQLNKI